MCFSILVIVLSLFYSNYVKTEMVSNEEVSGPIRKFNDYYCGSRDKLSWYSGTISNTDSFVSAYFLNKTADKLSSEGFTIFDQVVKDDDVLHSFSYSNGSFTGKLEFNQTFHAAGYVVGGKPASDIRAFYMAQIGEKKGNSITWLCDGVLINRQWVLSAAHCFTFPSVNPNLIRLGDYNLSVPANEDGLNPDGKYIEDYPIENAVLHPEFKFEERYHDLVLLKLPRKTPRYSRSINPICLPWGKHTQRNLVGSEVVLTGWGAQNFGGPKIDVLHQVDLKVFNASVCNKSYSQIPDNKVKYPFGLTDENILCVGWEEERKDACKGDSGAPIVYQDGEFSNLNFILAGIVSGGYGCGLKEYPGLYIPINKPKYLRWIRDTAFKDYIITHEECVSIPKDLSLNVCSLPYLPTKFNGILSNGSHVSAYQLNNTAEKLSSEGFTINVQNVKYDFITNFTFHNESYTETIGFNDTIIASSKFLLHEEPSSVLRALYMAQIGKKIGDKISWICEGVLINPQWILTSANCFTYSNENLNIIRLGEYSKSESVPESNEYRPLVLDNSIEKIVLHPNFKMGQNYHDLALLKISRIPEFSGSAVGVCLPWDFRTNLNITGNNVAVAGWNLKNFSEPESNILQEIDLKVFNTSVCRKALSSLPESSTKYPNGMSDEDILCAGWEQDEQYSCKQEKPGGPLVYREQIEGYRTPTYRDILAGIFSWGNGCGLKDYPGIYIPINKSKYLQWIKEVAFQ